jgi:peptide/nickel transport system substrate-binding protein
VGPGKGNQLPYVDTVKINIVMDISSRIAAVRTARGDWTYNLQREDAQSLMQTTPDLQYKKYLPVSTYVIGMRTDKADLPFKDLKVRQALMMATDLQALKDQYYGGDADLLAWPIANIKGFENAYMPLDQMPDSVKSLFVYNPDKAKQLLADAGYPNGFKTSILCQGISTQVDPVSAIKAMWAKVGVDLTLDPRDYTVYRTITRGRTYDQMVFTTSGNPAGYVNMFYYRGVSASNVSYVNNPPGQEPTLEQAFQEMQKYILVNQSKVDQIHKELMPYLIGQAYVIPMPSAYSFTFWWPWLKNYHGELGPNYLDSLSFVPWVWVDQNLKEDMIGRR